MVLGRRFGRQDREELGQSAVVFVSLCDREEATEEIHPSPTFEVARPINVALSQHRFQQSRLRREVVGDSRHRHTRALAISLIELFTYPERANTSKAATRISSRRFGVFA